MCKVYSLSTFKSTKVLWPIKEAIKKSEINSQEDLEIHNKNVEYIKQLSIVRGPIQEEIIS